MRFDKYLKELVESRVNKLPHVFESRDVEIACIAFGYKNRSVIQLLKLRGTALAQGHFKKIRPIDTRISKILTEEGSKIVTPVSAFITFNTQEGYERCNNSLFIRTTAGLKNKNRDQTFTLMSQSKPEVQDAPEPTNVIWENLEVSKREMTKRKCYVGTVIVLFVIVTFLFYTFLKTYSGQSKKQFPASINCKSVGSMFTSQADYKTYAELDKPATLES